MEMKWKDIQEKVEDWVIDAGRILLREQSKIKIVKRKADYLDIATNADLASEQFLITQIRKYFPTHTIVAEESGIDQRSSRYTWFIDPLDGTKDFARGLTSYNISIALEYKDELVVGVVYRPATGELYKSARGHGAIGKGKQMHVSQENSLKNSITYIHLPTYRKSQKEIDETLSILRKLVLSCNKVREAWEDTEVMSWLALGALEGYVLSVSGPAWWDVAPGILMVQEAGGRVTTMKGNPVTKQNYNKEGIVASNGKLHEQLLRLIQSV